MSPTAIEWTEETWNPVTGCSKVSPGCAHCYAETLSLRFGWSKLPWTPENAAANVVLRPDRLDQPLKWRRPRIVFVNSMSDLFHEQIPDEYIASIFQVMRSAWSHTFQVLTKRPERARDVLSRLGWDQPTPAGDWVAGFGDGYPYDRNEPLPNVWLGVSIENARYAYRADVLREIPAAVRFISAEPLLGSLFSTRAPRGAAHGARGSETGGLAREVIAPRPSLLDLAGIDWLIVGGESGLHHRPMLIEWARELRDAAVANGTAFFFKQWGGRTPKAGGRVLDGRTWDEMPESRA